jgi:uncharacterized protein (TIGR02246 family)
MSASAAPAADAQSLTAAALEQWLAKYGQAWEARDPAKAAALFTPNARYHEMPFDPPKVGREGIAAYWTEVTADQRDVDFKAEVVAVDGSHGVARWSARLRSAASGTRIELDGVFVLTFDPAGLCTELREWWHLRTDP